MVEVWVMTIALVLLLALSGVWLYQSLFDINIQYIDADEKRERIKRELKMFCLVIILFLILYIFALGTTAGGIKWTKLL